MEPLYAPVQVIRPVNECRMERVTCADPDYNAYAAPVAGSIIDGVIETGLPGDGGNTTDGGGLVGAGIGKRLSAASRRSPTSVHM